MSRSDDLRDTLHDPDRYLGPADQEPGLFYRTASWLTALVGSIVMTLVGVTGLIFLWWLAVSFMASLGL